MPSITERIQAVITSALGVTPSMYTGDWHKYMDAQSIAAGQLNERQIALANTLSGSSLNSSTALIYLQSYFLRQQNLLIFSEQFDNAAWTKTNSSITVNAIAAPDGTATVDFLKEDTATSTHIAFEVVTGLTAGAQFTWSFFAKAGTRTKVNVSLNQGANAVSTLLDLTTGTFSAAAIAGAWTGPAATVTALPNGWYRASVTANIVGSTALSCQIQLSNGASTSYLGDGTSGLYIWGAQLNTGPFPLEYSRTDAAALP